MRPDRTCHQWPMSLVFTKVSISIDSSKSKFDTTCDNFVQWLIKKE